MERCCSNLPRHEMRATTGYLLLAWNAAYAAVPITDSFLLWDGERKEAVIDLDPTTPGIEEITRAKKVLTSARNGNGMVKYTYKESIYRMEQGWRLQQNGAGVGNYLSGIVGSTNRTNLGEIRITREREINNVRNKIKRQYYDPYTCALIAEAVIIGPWLTGSWP